MVVSFYYENSQESPAEVSTNKELIENLRSQLYTAKNTLPKDVGNGIDYVDIKLSEDSVINYYKFKNLTSDNLKKVKVQMALRAKQQMSEELCLKDSLTLFILKNGLSYKYVYSDMLGKDVLSIKVKYQDCLKGNYKK